MEKTKFIIKQFDVVVYPRQVWIAAGGTREDLAKRFTDDDGDPMYVVPEKIKSSEALAFSVYDARHQRCGSLVWFHDITRITLRNVAHESVHAANFIFSDLGIRIDVDNDEPQAYLVGFIADCIEKVQIEVVREKLKPKKK